MSCKAAVIDSVNKRPGIACGVSPSGLKRSKFAPISAERPAMPKRSEVFGAGYNFSVPVSAVFHVGAPYANNIAEQLNCSSEEATHAS